MDYRPTPARRTVYSARAGPRPTPKDRWSVTFYSMETRHKDFYRDMFELQVKKADMRAVFTEYAWNLKWCDPCGADPLSLEELLSLGVHRLNETPPDFVPGRGRRPIVPPMGGAHDVFAPPMRGHYDDQHIPGVVKCWQ
jgi:hypothetical protein